MANNDQTIIIATRGSALALAQANAVAAQCRAAFPRLRFELKVIKTTGDKLQTASLAQDLLRDWKAQRETMRKIADAMPADKFGYKPTPAQRSYGEQIMHVVGADQSVVGMLGGKTPAPAINLKAATKAEVMTALRQSMDYWEVVLKEFTDQQLNERVATPPSSPLGPSSSRLRLVYASITHSLDIYGQMVVYLRLNGIVPPASRRGGL